MKITRVAVDVLRVPVDRPYVAGGRTVDANWHVLARITTSDGAEGVGYVVYPRPDLMATIGQAARELGEHHGTPVCGHVVPEIQVHLLAAIPNGHKVEYVPRSAGILRSMPRIENGELVAPQAPGLGLELDDSAVRRHRVS